MKNEQSNIAIVGSGFLGLTLALRLSNAGHNVTIFESASEIGGLAGTWQIGDVIWDKHYHVTLLSDSYTRNIAKEIGLENEFEWVETKTGFYTDGKLVSMSNTLEFLKFPPLDLISKLRLGATIFYASRVKDWKALEKISVEEWLTKLSGKKTFEKIWKPLLKAKLGEAYKETSAAFIWATIQRMYAARNSGLKKEMFGYVRGGYATVLKRFGDHLEAKKVDFRLNSRITQIEKLADGKIAVSVADSDKSNSVGRIPTSKVKTAPTLKVSNNNIDGSSPTGTVESIESSVGFHPALLSSSPSATGNEFEDGDFEDQKTKTENLFDQVILTCPSNIAANILQQLDDAEKQKLENIKYQGIVCASVLTKKPLSEFYVTNITDETPFTGIIEMSALVDKKEFDGNALIYLPKYVAPDDELFEKSDEEIEDIFLPALEKMYPHFDSSDVIEFKISRVRQVFPLPTLEYSENVPSVKTSLENVYVVNSAQITNGTLNVNETIQLAEKFLEKEFAREIRERHEMKTKE
ncbi:MAG: NAD(P)/FAD-dependent oxidoreductase [Pyrinomonadaceae bacterium]